MVGDAASRRLVDEWAEESYIALRSFKPKRMAPPAILTDAEWQHIKAPTLYSRGGGASAPETCAPTLSSLCASLLKTPRVGGASA